MKLIAECEMECGAHLRLYADQTAAKIEVLDTLNFVRASLDRLSSPARDRWFHKDEITDQFNHVSIFAEHKEELYEMLKGATEMLAQIVEEP